MRHISFFISPADEDDPSRRIIIAGLERRAKRRYVDKGKCWRIASVGIGCCFQKGAHLQIVIFCIPKREWVEWPHEPHSAREFAELSRIPAQREMKVSKSVDGKGGVISSAAATDTTCVKGIYLLSVHLIS